MVGQGVDILLRKPPLRPALHNELEKRLSDSEYEVSDGHLYTLDAILAACFAIARCMYEAQSCYTQYERMLHYCIVSTASSASKHTFQQYCCYSYRHFYHRLQVRLEAVHKLCDCASNSLDAVSTTLMKALGIRLQDKKAQIHKDAATGLAQIYSKYISKKWCDSPGLLSTSEDTEGQYTIYVDGWQQYLQCSPLTLFCVV
jgi:hypothetical protein